MNISDMELALGTAQFGLKYGITGRGKPIPTEEVRQLLARAWELGVRVIDTAPAYGDIEESLNELTGDYPFVTVSKISAIPQKSSNDAVEDHVSESIYVTQSRLGARLNTLLFHSSDDLLGEQGDIAWQAATKAVHQSSVRLGVSCYSPDEIDMIRSRYPISVVQIPGNALDQRINSFDNGHKIEVHLRSAFLQGILLASPDKVSEKLPQATNAITAWRRWCEERELTPLKAALSLVKGMSNVRYCIIGVDSLSQLEDIAEAWVSAVALKAPALAIEQSNVIDPRCWQLQSVEQVKN